MNIQKLENRLEIIEMQLQFLIEQLPQKEFKELIEIIKDLKIKQWENEIGEDI